MFLNSLKSIFIVLVFSYVFYVLFEGFVQEPLRIQENLDTFHIYDYLAVGDIVLSQKTKKVNFKELLYNPRYPGNSDLSKQLTIIHAIDPKSNVIARKEFMILNVPKFKMTVFYEWIPDHPYVVKVTFLKNGQELSREVKAIVMTVPLEPVHY